MIILLEYCDEIPNKKPPIAIPKFAKKYPKKTGTYTYTMSMNLHNYAVIFFNLFILFSIMHNRKELA